MTTTFETAQVGDRVYDLDYGWCEIASIHQNSKHPININVTKCCNKTYTYDGKCFDNQVTQCLFWDEVTISPPTKPLPKLEVDTKVFVWDNDYNMKQKRHFSHFEANKNICVFVHGGTSWSATQTVEYHNWELAKD